MQMRLVCALFVIVLLAFVVEDGSPCRSQLPRCSTRSSSGDLFQGQGSGLLSGSCQGSVAECGTLAEAAEVLRTGRAWAGVFVS
ncbi:hypothetical protein HPB50_010287 [Hyalomma asiaticum]|uniref:Uncharacterized protein n=1 Tax=Hyalomma asiaticum TaxID=266040 RepID=A0ACB7RT02_HYAAI|nr:hypothetical protein HPB50_010287 [Hyalomma asiaticum]